MFTTQPPATEQLSRDEIEVNQANRLKQLLEVIDGRNRFYTNKFADAGILIGSLNFQDDLPKLPFTNKAELITDQNNSPPWGTALSEPLANYTRYNQTSSTTGKPLRWLDTTASWQWMLECWKAVYRAAGVDSTDRIFFPFSFGPFLGFWTAFEAGTQLGAQCVPAGGMTSEMRLGLIDVLRPTVVCCTPTYALRLVEVAKEENRNDTLSLADSENGWGARVIDHHGLTEVGPISFECWDNPGFVHVNENEYICEVIDPDSAVLVPDGNQGELVVTNLGRLASPVIRYRTRDIVIKTTERCRCGRTLARLKGGILSRADDMVCLRGVNIYPTAIESVVRTFNEVIEYRASVTQNSALGTLLLEIEVDAADPTEVTRLVEVKLRETLGLSVIVNTVEKGTLPRFEMKARRFILKGN